MIIEVFFKMEDIGCDQCRADPLSVCPLHGINADQLHKDLVLLKDAMRMAVDMNSTLQKKNEK